MRFFLSYSVFCGVFLVVFFRSECGNTSVVSVVPEVFVSACVEDCGTYGECRLLRSYSYLYAACVCKAGTTNANHTLQTINKTTQRLEFLVTDLEFCTFNICKATTRLTSDDDVQNFAEIILKLF